MNSIHGRRLCRSAQNDDMDTTFETIRRLALDTLDVPEVQLLRARTLNEAGIDSLATLDLVFAIEAHYGISLRAEDLTEVHSLKDFAVIAERLISREACQYENPHENHHETHHET
jgi:acyl carrier protein